MGLERPAYDYAEEERQRELEKETVASPEHRDNVIEFPKQARPETDPEQSPESDTEVKEARLGKLRAEILESPESKKKPPDSGDGDEEKEDKKLHFSEGFREYKVCEACNGSGRRRWIFRCPVCKGVGTIVVRSSDTYGVYGVEKKEEEAK